MYKLSIVIALFASISACNNADDSTSRDGNTNSVNNQTNAQSSNKNKSTGNVDLVVEQYLQLKDALVSDDGEEAGAVGRKLFEAIEGIDTAQLESKQRSKFLEIKDDAAEHAEHISKNAGNLKHQREHFETLSQEVYELVNGFNVSQKLYKLHCPMFNNKKGAHWLSTTQQIQNPYYGKEMLTCGNVIEEVQ